MPAHSEGVDFTLNKESGKRYFLQPVSLNYHSSLNLAEIEFSAAVDNTPPVLGEIIFNEGKETITPLTDVLIKFKKATDSEDQVIDYQILISISGPNGNFRYEVEDYEIVDDYI